MLEQEVKRGSLWCEDGSSQGGMVAADVVLTTKSLAAQRSGMDLNNCTGQYLCAKTQNTDDLSRHRTDRASGRGH